MNTMSSVHTATAAVTGARHLRAGRNGQDAAAAWTGADAGAIVVCDGCGAGASSEVGARLGAQLVIRALSARLAAGMTADDPTLWTSVRAEVVDALARLAEAMAPPAGPADLIYDHLLFTIVAAAVSGDAVSVWTLGDGAYAIGDAVRVLGPFPDNQPPYLAYDLLGMPAPAELVATRLTSGLVLVTTDGVAEVGFEQLALDRELERYLGHPDALRRRLALLARTNERIDWKERRTVRAPAALQDDGAVALMRWRS